MKNILDFIITFALLFVSGLAGCVEKPEPVLDPVLAEVIPTKTPSIAEMKTAEMGYYRFLLPKEMKRSKLRGIDTFFARFDGPKFSVRTEYGTLVDPAPKRLQFFEYLERDAEVIDRRKARVYSYKYLEKGMNVEFTTIVGYFENPRNDGNNLLVEIDCLIGVNCESEAIRIIRSVSFSP